MSPERGFEFLGIQLSRSDQANQTKLCPLVKNPHLLFIFSELMTILMFEDIRLVNFHKLDKWRNVVPCWLNVFLNFAHDSYRFITFPTKDKVGSITDVKDHDADTTEYAFGFLDTSFHTIIDNAYRSHLAPVFLSFGASDESIEIKGKEKGNWTTSFSDYRAEVLENLAEWAQGRDRPKDYCTHLYELVDRITYILDKGCQDYPFISQLNSPLPLLCNTFIQDLGQDLYQLEDSILEVRSAIFTNSLNIPFNIYQFSKYFF